MKRNNSISGCGVGGSFNNVQLHQRLSPLLKIIWQFNERRVRGWLLPGGGSSHQSVITSKTRLVGETESTAHHVTKRRVSGVGHWLYVRLANLWHREDVKNANTVLTLIESFNSWLPEVSILLKWFHEGGHNVEQRFTCWPKEEEENKLGNFKSFYFNNGFLQTTLPKMQFLKKIFI